MKTSDILHTVGILLNSIGIAAQTGAIPPLAPYAALILILATGLNGSGLAGSQLSKPLDKVS